MGDALELQSDLYHAFLTGLRNIKHLLRLRSGKAVRNYGANIDLTRHDPIQREVGHPGVCMIPNQSALSPSYRPERRA